MQPQFGLTLLRLAKDHDWSQGELARRAQINPSNISRIVAGDVVRAEDSVKALIGVFSTLKERGELVRAYVRDTLVRLGIPPDDMAVPLEPSTEILLNIADRSLYELFVRIAEAIRGGDNDLRDLLEMTVRVRLPAKPLSVVPDQAAAPTTRAVRRQSAANQLSARRPSAPARPAKRAGRRGS